MYLRILGGLAFAFDSFGLSIKIGVRLNRISKLINDKLKICLIYFKKELRSLIAFLALTFSSR